MNRRAQKPITIRSDRAAARLAILTRGGRSQVQVIEEALERMPVPPSQEEKSETRLAAIRAIQDQVAAERHLYPSMAEFDREEYDEDGLPR
jgi:antitoxin VapB